jgi:1-acyl-sn-glycerol-3-phosphate acyltransferase
MLQFLPACLIGIIAIFLHTVNLIIFPLLVVIIGSLRLLLPFHWWRQSCDWLIQVCEIAWLKISNFIMRLTMDTNWEIHSEGKLQRKGRYFLIANHQSWVDIFVLYKLFGGRVPLLVFFIKKQLMMLPVIGLAMWFAGFPFMQRHSKSYLKKHPEKKLDDFETTKRLCKRFETHPVTVINFLETTRFTLEKKHSQHSPYEHLLKPHTSKFAFVLSAMGESLHDIIDVTIVYPAGKVSLWDFVCGKMKRIIVYYKVFPIAENLRNRDYSVDREYRALVQQKVNELWLEKDQLITKSIQKWKTKHENKNDNRK